MNVYVKEHFSEHEIEQFSIGDSLSGVDCNSTQVKFGIQYQQRLPAIPTVDG